MKKILSLFLAALIAVSVAIPCFADGAPPAFMEYEAIVSNKSGAEDIYEDLEPIPYQTKVTVTYEYLNDEGKIVSSFDYNGRHYGVYSSDLSKINSKVGMDKAVKLISTFECAVIDKKGLVLREGPSVSYKEITTIPYGTEIKSNYGDDFENFNWIFVSYGNYSGWAEIVRCATIEKNPKANKIEVFADSLRLSDSPYDDGKKIGEKIAPGTVLSFRYDFQGSVYVEYKGTKGWLNCYSGTEGITIIRYCDAGAYINISGLVLYEKPGFNQKNIKDVCPIEANKFYYITKSCYEEVPESSGYAWYYLTTEKGSGWACIDESTGEDEEREGYIFTNSFEAKAEKDVKYYSEPNKKSSSIGTIPKGTKLPAVYDLGDCIFTKYNGKYVWIDSSEWVYIYRSYAKCAADNGFCSFMPGLYTEKVTQTKKEVKEAETTSAPSFAKTEKSVLSEETDDKKTKKLSTAAIVCLCVFAACVVSGTAVVTVILINKKKEKAGSDKNPQKK